MKSIIFVFGNDMKTTWIQLKDIEEDVVTRKTDIFASLVGNTAAKTKLSCTIINLRIAVLLFSVSPYCA